MTVNIFRHIVFGIAALLALAAGCPLHGQDTRAYENRKAKLEKDIALIDRQLKDNASRSSTALNSLTLIRKKISDRKELLEESEGQLADISEKISLKNNEIRKIQNRLDTLTLYYGKLVRSAYKNRSPSVWYMYILASENVGQAFRRIGYLRNLSSEMNRQGEKIISTKEELGREADSLAVLQKKAQVIRDSRAAEMSRLKNEESQSEKLVSQLQKNRTKYQNELASKKRQVDALNREIQRLIASAVKGGKSGRSATSKTTVDTKLDAEFSRNKGKLPWPADGPVVDHFGQHYHPVFKSVKLPFNNGITMALDKDSPVKAVFDGTVKQIVVMPGYNKCVLVQHGGYFTFYCKLGFVSVKPGDKIKTGEVIGTVDNIDNQYQLHFQIWKGTTPQNPELWLK